MLQLIVYLKKKLSKKDLSAYFKVNLIPHLLTPSFHSDPQTMIMIQECLCVTYLLYLMEKVSLMFNDIYLNYSK